MEDRPQRVPVGGAVQSGAPVLPIASWGQEKILRSWRGLRRARVYIRVGEPVSLEATDFSAPNLRRESERVMRKLAALLPEEYRGVYAAADSAAVTRNAA